MLPNSSEEANVSPEKIKKEGVLKCLYGSSISLISARFSRLFIFTFSLEIV